MSHPIRCIVFDFDGVLVDSNGIKRAAYFDIFRKVDNAAAVIEWVLNAYPSADRYETITRVIEGCGKIGSDVTNLPIQMFVDGYNDICERVVSTCAEVEGASNMLVELARRYPLYLNSATPEQSLRRIVERREWTQYFRQVLGRPQSKVTNLQQIAAAEVLPSMEIVFIGDHQGDLAAAQEFGCRFIAFRTTGSNLDFDGNDVTVIHRLADLHSVLETSRPGTAL